MKSIESFLSESTRDNEKNTHLTHFEDSIIDGGPPSAFLALQYAIKILYEPQNKDFVARSKLDGAPALICGIDPESKKFFVGTKSVFNKKTPKANFTKEDIEQNYSDKPDLAEKLKLCLSYLPQLKIAGVVQGDFLFDHASLSSKIIDGDSYVTWHPNTITYAIQKDDPIAQAVSNAKIGICFHTPYIGDTLGTLRAKFSHRVVLKPTKDVWLQTPEIFNVQASKQSKAKSIIEDASKQLNDLNRDVLGFNSELLLMSRNVLVREGRVNLVTPEAAYDSYVKFTKERLNGKKNLEASIKFIIEFKDSYIQLFKFINTMNQLKLFLVNYLNRVSVTAIKMFIEKNGEFTPTFAEGYVISSSDNNMAFKMVDRNVYSKMNFELDKDWDSEISSTTNKKETNDENVSRVPQSEN